MSQRADRKTTLKKIIYSIELDVSVELFINCQLFHWSSTVSANSNSIGLHTQTVRDTFFRRVLYQTNLNMKRRHVRFHIAIMYHGCKCWIWYSFSGNFQTLISIQEKQRLPTIHGKMQLKCVINTLGTCTSKATIQSNACFLCVF